MRSAKDEMQNTHFRNCAGTLGGERLVRQWYALWNGEEQSATLQEVEDADEMIERYGEGMAEALIPLLAEILRRAWPKAKRFGSVKVYLPDAVRAYHARISQERQREEWRQRQQQERVQAVQEEADDRKLSEVWERLPTPLRQRIERYVRDFYPVLRGRPKWVYRQCLNALVQPGLAFFME